MAGISIDPRLISIAIAEAPQVIAWIRAAFTKANPGSVEPTDEEVIAGLTSALASSLAKDEAYLAAHPD